MVQDGLERRLSAIRVADITRLILLHEGPSAIRIIDLTYMASGHALVSKG